MNPSDELIKEILQNEDIATEYDKFCQYNNTSKHLTTAQKHISKVDEMIQKLPKVELLKMKYFIGNMRSTKKKGQIPQHVLDRVLSHPEILGSMRIVLDPDEDKILGAKHFDKVEEAIRNEMKIHKKKHSICTLS